MKLEPEKQLSKIVATLKDFDLGEKVGFWFSGKTGHGKTMLLLSLFNSISWKYYHANGGLKGQVQFYNYTDLCGVLRQNPNDHDLVCKIREVEYLFIDDVGTSKSTDFIQEKIYSIFNYRCENELPTFVTTNLEFKDINAEFTERMGSRIKESAVWLELKDGKDYRSKIFIENMQKYKHLLT